MNAVIRPRAQDDILRQFRWYLVEQDAHDAAFRFMEAVEASVERLLNMPHIGAVREIRNPALVGLRFWPVKEFEEFLIFLCGGRRNGEGHSHPAWQARPRSHSEKGVGRR